MFSKNGQLSFTEEEKSITFPLDTSLLSIDGFMPDNFVAGIEILNDETTPMEFVVSVLIKNFSLSHQDAVKSMLEIHTNGGAVFPLQDFESAKAIVLLVDSKTKQNNHSLVCRAVSVQEC